MSAQAQESYLSKRATEAGRSGRLVVIDALQVRVGGEMDTIQSITQEPIKRRYRKYDRAVRVRRSPRSLAVRVDEIRTGHFERLGAMQDVFGRPAMAWGYFPAGWNKPKWRLTTGECLTSCNCPVGRRDEHCKHAALWEERNRKAGK